MSGPSSQLNLEIVRAGAGAGKTTKLTRQVLDVVTAFYQQHQRYPHLVVTTFTRKATQELRERLMLEAVSRKDLDLLEYVSSKSHLSISTIHGVLSLFLSRFASHLDLDPSFRILSGREIGRESKKILRELVVESAVGQSLLEIFRFNDLNDLCLRYFDWKSIYPDLSPFTLADYQDETQIMASELAVACDQFIETVGRESTHPKWIEFGLGFGQIAEVLRSGSAWTEIRSQVLGRLESLSKPRKSANNPDLSDGALVQLEGLRKSLKDLGDQRFDPASWPAIFQQQELFVAVVEPFCERLRAHKYQHGQLQMADLELASLEVVRLHPDLAQAFSREWDYWLIDEYQDTSPIQVELLNHLIGESPHFVVGDPQQSIYLFRGARMEVFEKKERDVKAAGGLQNYLRRNYRSVPELLLFFNDVFTKASRAFEPMEPRPHDKLEPERVVATFAIATEAKPEDEHHSELKAIVAQVSRLINRGARPEDICVLGRTNRHLLEVARALNHHHISTQVHAASGFYDRREIQDALALLTFLVHPHNNRNLMELLRSPWFRVEDADLVALAVSSQHSLWAELCARAEGDVARVVGQLRDWVSESHNSGISHTFGKALVHHGFFDFSHRFDTTGRREANLWKLLSRLRQDEVRPGFNYLDFVAASLNDLRDSEGAEESDATPALEPNRVNLMTVHASKGLQFQHVLVPFAGRKPQLTLTAHFVIDEERRKWSISMLNETDETLSQPWLGHLQIVKGRQREVNESDRVLYVALTRAKQSVFVSWTGSPQENSWAKRFHLDLTCGTHATANYTYEVQTGPWVAEAIHIAPATEQMIRDPFLPGLSTTAALQDETVAGQRLHYQSVSELLSAKEREPVALNLSQGQSATSPQRPTNELKKMLFNIQRSVEGTLAHRLFELMKYQHDISPLVGQYFSGREREVSEAVRYVQELTHPPMLDLLRNGEVEWSFILQEGAILLEGQIDMWGRAPDQSVWIIDYKTGSPASLEKAFEQLQLYSLALRRSGLVHSQEVIQLAVVYPFHAHTELRPAWTARRVVETFLEGPGEAPPPHAADLSPELSSNLSPELEDPP